VTRRRPEAKGTAARKQQESDIFLRELQKRTRPNLRYISFDIYFPADEGVTIEWTACICGHCHVCQQAASKTGTLTCSPPRLPPRRIAAHSFSALMGEPDLQLVE